MCLICEAWTDVLLVLQTRLTALDLIGYAAGDERPRQFVHMPEQELEDELVSIKVSAFQAICLKSFDSLFTLPFTWLLTVLLTSTSA